MLIKEAEERHENFWDLLSKRYIQEFPEIILPVLNELYGKNYQKDTKIEFLDTDYVNREANGTRKEITTDVMICVDGCDLYHIEIQSKLDTEISSRFLEYDMSIVLKHTANRKELSDGERKKSLRLSREFHYTRPHPILINLSHPIHEPDVYENVIEEPYGEKWNYRIRVINVQKLSLQEIVEKKWYFFIPFLPIRFAKKMGKKAGNKPSEDEKFAEAVVFNDVEDTDITAMKVITEELIPMIKECRQFLNRKQEIDEGYAVAERLWEGLIESCIYLFGENKDLIKELDEMEPKFYFRDEKLAMAQERIGVLSLEYASVREENDKIKAEKEKYRMKKPEFKKKRMIYKRKIWNWKE